MKGYEYKVVVIQKDGYEYLLWDIMNEYFESEERAREAIKDFLKREERYRSYRKDDDIDICKELKICRRKIGDWEEITENSIEEPAGKNYTYKIIAVLENGKEYVVMYGLQMYWNTLDEAKSIIPKHIENKERLKQMCRKRNRTLPKSLSDIIEFRYYRREVEDWELYDVHKVL